MFGSSVSYGYDPVGRLAGLGHDLAGTGWDQSLTFAYNPASQIVTRTSSNDLYASTSAYNVSRPYSVNGLNQYTAAGGATFAYDANGNLTSDGSSSFVYDAENRLVSRSNGTTLSYDPNGRLWRIAGPSETTVFVYDGDRLVEEYDAAGTRLRAYAHGPGVDEPLVWYELTGGAMRRYLHADHQGSIVALTDEYGTLLHANAYDPWGIRNAGDRGRFGCTGQMWLTDLGMYYYKARIYSPTLGRFLQTDPVGYKDQVNLYAYVGNDPVNHADPRGQEMCGGTPSQCAAYRQALDTGARAAESRALTRAERIEIRREVDSIKADNRYVILFMPQAQINTVTDNLGFAFTTITNNGTVYTVLPDNFSELYEKYPAIPAVERAGVVMHEGSHREDFESGKIKRGDKFSRTSETEKKADRRQDLTIKGGTEVCTGTRLCNAH